MVIYVAEDGSWFYSWEFGEKVKSFTKYRGIDLDRWHEYDDLSELEVLACLEALEE